VFVTKRGKDTFGSDLPRWPSVTDMFEHYMPDGVIIANEASKHEATAAEVWMHRLDMPVFVEKPFPLSTLYGSGLLHDEGILLVDHTQLFNENLIALRALGMPKHIYATDRGLGPFRADCNPLWDYGPHAVALALYLAGFPAKGGVHVRDATLSPSPAGCSVELDLRIGEHTTAILTVGNNATTKARYCTNQYENGALREWDGLHPCSTPPLTAALAAFCDAVRNGRAPEGDVRFGWALPLAVTQVLAEAEEVLRKRCTPL
jgi:predicted dehydrogenase